MVRYVKYIHKISPVIISSIQGQKKRPFELFLFWLINELSFALKPLRVSRCNIWCIFVDILYKTSATVIPVYSCQLCYISILKLWILTCTVIGLRHSDFTFFHNFKSPSYLFMTSKRIHPYTNIISHTDFITCFAVFGIVTSRNINLFAGSTFPSNNISGKHNTIKFSVLYSFNGWDTTWGQLISFASLPVWR